MSGNYRVEYFPQDARPRPRILHWGFYFPFTVWVGGSYPDCRLVGVASTKRAALRKIRQHRLTSSKRDRSTLQVIHEEAS